MPWSPSQAEGDKKPEKITSREGLSDVGAGAVHADLGEPLGPPEPELFADASIHRFDAFPMAGIYDSPRVQRVKLTTAVSNMLVLLAPTTAVQYEVYRAVREYDDVQLCRFMDVRYEMLRFTGMSKDLPSLSMVMDEILED